MDRYDLYERAAQSPDREARFLRALAGDAARTLGEDFCGSGAVARAWAALRPENRAVCVDWDEEPIGALRRRAAGEGVLERLDVRCAGVLEVNEPADVVCALNFSIGYHHERGDLVRYLTHVRARLDRSGGEGGVFVCDVYGGADAFAPGVSEVDLRDDVAYTWEQREADALTARVVDAMHFEAEGQRFDDAFVYDWRLWSVPELRDALREAGFSKVEVYDRLGDAEDDEGNLYLREATGDDLDENWVVYVVGRA